MQLASEYSKWYGAARSAKSSCMRWWNEADDKQSLQLLYLSSDAAAAVTIAFVFIDFVRRHQSPLATQISPGIAGMALFAAENLQRDNLCAL